MANCPINFNLAIARGLIPICLGLLASSAARANSEAVQKPKTPLLARGYGRNSNPWAPRVKRDQVSEKNPPGLHLKGTEAGVKVEGKSRYTSNVTSSTRQSFTQAYDIMAKVEGDYGLGLILAGGRSHIAVRGYAREKWAETSGSEKTYALDNGSYFPVTNLAPAGKFRFLTALVDAELALPLAENVEIQIDQNAGYALPDVLITRLTAIYGTSMSVKYDDKVYEGRLSARNRTVYVAQQPPAGPVGFYNYFGYINEYFDSASNNTFSGHLLNFGTSAKRKWETFNVEGRIGYSTATPATGYIVYGEASSFSFGVSLEKKFPFGISLSPSMGRSMLNSYKQQVKSGEDGTNVDVTVEGTVDEIGAELAVAPIEWFTVAGQFGYSVFNYSAVPPELADNFNQGVPKQSSGFSVMVGTQKQF